MASANLYCPARSGREAERLPLDDLAVVMASWYDDDEPGSPWRVSLYLDEQASDKQHDALAAMSGP